MSRRSPGEGSITERPGGLWQGALQVEGRRRTVHGKTEKEVKAKLQGLQKEAHQNGALSTPGTRTLADLLDLWLRAAGPGLKPRTLHDYTALSDRYIRPALGHVRLSRLGPERLQALYADLQGRGLERAPAQVHALLHRALRMAVLWQWLPSNPADRVLKPGYHPGRKAVWSPGQLATFLGGTAEDRHAPLWMFLASTGCRIGETLALKWEAVDLEAGTVAIRENLQRIGGAWVVCRPKSRAGERTVTLPPQAVAALRKQRVRQGERRLREGPEWHDGGLVFPGLHGDPVCTSTIQRALAEACRRLGLPVVNPHGLRHLHASLLLGRGVPVTAVAARLGHSTAATTTRVYAHELAGQDHEAAEAMEAVLR